MKKTKFSKFLVLMLVVCLTCSILLLTACNNGNNSTNNQPNRTDKDEQLVQNGDFTFATGNDYPRTPTAWSGNIGGSGSYQPDGGLDVIKAGVINVGVDYENNKHKWNSHNNPKTRPGARENDKNILMIYASKPSSYSFVSDSFNIDANKYYKLSFWVNTSPTLSGAVDDNGKPLENTNYGAYVNVNGGNVRGEWMDIKTNGTWKQYTMYIEGGVNAPSTLRITFGLGYGDKTDKHLTKGHVFFDDVVLEESTKEAYDKATVGGEFEHKDSFKFSNANFTNYSKFYASTPNSPTGWNFGYGGVDEDKANNIPSSERAIINRGLINLDPTHLKNNLTSYGFDQTFDISNLQKRVGAGDTFALLLNANKNYSINYVANSTITIEKGKIYRIGVFVKALNDARGTIILSNDNETHSITFDKDKFYIDDDRTGKTLTKDANGWSEIVFNIRGNNTNDITYNMTLALGTGGKSKKDDGWSWSKGHALFDDVNFKEKAVSANDKNSSSEKAWAIDNTSNCSNIDLNEIDENTKIIKNDFQNGNLVNKKAPTPEGYVLPDKFELNPTSNVKFNGTINVLDAPSNKIDLPFEVLYKLGSENTSAEVANNVLKIASSKGGTTIGLKFTPDTKLKATMNKQYRLAFWVKTEDMPKTSGMNFSLNVLDKEDKVVKTEQITEVNSANISKDNDKYKGWQEVVFYITGDSYQDTNYSIEMNFGRGNMFDETIATGTAYIFNINLKTIDLTTFNNANTSSIIKKVDMASSTIGNESIANGMFNKIVTSSSSFNNDGKLDKFGTPQSWSVDNDSISDALKKDQQDGDKTVKVDKDYKKGVIDLTNIPEIFKNEGITDIDVNKISALSNQSKNRYALAIYGKDQIVFNFKSSYINLNPNSFYSIHVKVYTAGGAKATISLSSSSPHEENDNSLTYKNIQTTTDGFTEYSFFIKTGFTSASVNLVLSLGDPSSFTQDNKTGLSSGLVVFDDAILLNHSSEEAYEKFKGSTEKPSGLEKHNELSFHTDGFATSSYDKTKITEPNGWTKNAISSAPDINNKPSTVAGVINLDSLDVKEIWTYTDKGETDKTKQEYLDFVSKKENLVKSALLADKGYRTEFGKSVLMIDNIIGTGYSVTNSTGKELEAKKYYKISIWVYTDIADAKEGLTLSLKISDRNQDVVKIENINNKGWTEYSFYINNANDIKDTKLSAYLTLQLGTRQNINDKDELKPVTGTIFADNFKVTEVTKEDYDKAEKDTENKNQATIAYVPDKDIDPDQNKPSPNPENGSVDWKMLSWAIPTIILAVMLLVVIGVFIYKKYSGPKKHTKFKGKTNKPKKAEVTKKDNFDNFND